MIGRQIRAILAAAAIAALPSASSAALTATLEPANYTFTQGTAATGSFEVIVELAAGSTTPESVAGYALRIDIVGPSAGVTFDLPVPVTDATNADDGYIFPGIPSPSDTDTATETRLAYLDIDELNPALVESGDEYGAGTIFFEVAADAAPGTYTFTFDTTPVIGSAFQRPDLSEIQTQFVNATITILPAAVPEPSAVLLLALTGVAGVGIRRFRRGTTAAA